MNAMSFEHWQLDFDAEGIVWATLDKAGESANSLSAEVMGELGRILDVLENKPPKGLIFRSGKAAGFIAGADIQEFEKLETSEQAIGLVRRGWDLFNRVLGQVETVKVVQDPHVKCRGNVTIFFIAVN